VPTERPADRGRLLEGPSTGSPEDLRQRLDRLPSPHPSSSRYIDGLSRGHDARNSDVPERSVEGRRRDLADRAARDAMLRPETRDLPSARDVIGNLDRAEMDPRKLSDYAMNPDHAQNNGKAKAWAALGYDVSSPASRVATAQELRELICRYLLPNGRVAAAKESADGTDYRVVNGFIGPNDRHGTLTTCWRVPTDGQAGPRLLTTWLAVHRDDRA
jgi:hypothetical protein